MKFLGSLTPVEGTVYRVGLIHSMPFDAVNGLHKTEAELAELGVLVEDVPEAEPPEGQRTAGIFVDKSDGRVWWEYEDIPESETDVLRRAIAEMSILIGGSAS